MSINFLLEREGEFIFIREGVSVHFYKSVWDCSLL